MRSWKFSMYSSAVAALAAEVAEAERGADQADDGRAAADPQRRLDERVEDDLAGDVLEAGDGGTGDDAGGRGEEQHLLRAAAEGEDLLAAVAVGGGEDRDGARAAPSVEHHRAVGVGQDPVLEVQPNGTGEHGALEVGAEPHEVGDLVAVADRR